MTTDRTTTPDTAPTGAGRRSLRVALVSEGTYPFAMGGVSVWCDQLISNLPEHRFQFVALTVDGTSRALWRPPANVEGLRILPLWTPARPGQGRPSEAGRAAAAELLDELVRALPDDGRATCHVARFLRALRGVALEAGARRSTAGMFTEDRALAALGRSWREQAGTALSLRDALDCGDMLEHLLRPLQEAPVRADLVHASMNGPSMLVGMAALWANGTPVVLSEHGIYLRERYLLEADTAGVSPALRFLRLNFFRLLAAAAYQVATAIAPHSRYNRRWQLRCGADPARMHTMYNGVDLDDFPVADGEPQTPTVVFLGRIDPVKDVRTLVRAFATVHREMPTARMQVFGAAPAGQEAYLEGCRRLAAELSLGSSLTFEGPAPEPSAAYRAGSVVALSSISEGFPYSLLEAMASGRPVVCTNVGGVAEAVGDAGLVVPPRDPVALGRALLSLLRDDRARARMGRRARERVSAEFTVDRWSAAYADLYARVTTGSARAADTGPRDGRADRAGDGARPDLHLLADRRPTPAEVAS